MLDKHASSTTSNVAESQRELQKIKQNLDMCSALLKERSLEVQTNSGFLERFLGKTYRRKQEFMRQKSLLQNVSDALNRIISTLFASCVRSTQTHRQDHMEQEARTITNNE
jgi:septal ring factor EnvC (AmiA/AmiB activator)